MNRNFQQWVYHIYNRWFEKMIIFKSDKDFERFYKIVLKYSKSEKYKNIKIISYCFLPNHFHFLINSNWEEISKFFWDVWNAYAKYFNVKYGRKWQLFEWRFKAKFIDNEEYFYKCLAYVNFNALKHWIVSDISSYKRSSYNQIENKDKIDRFKDLILDELEI